MSTNSTPASVDDCHCCEQTDAAGALKTIFNAPGLSALDNRTGVYGSFLNEMIRRLPLLDLATIDPSLHGRPLARLTTRDPNDPSVALIDAWASALDVLTFYQERIANEGFLRTATERRSVLELARQVGYELAPGLAASVDLAFTAETVVGQPHEATIEIGTKVMSVPGQNEKPQIFEAIEALDIRGDWNQFAVVPSTATVPDPPALEVIKTRAQVPETVGTPTPLYDLYIDASTPVVVGDAILFDPTVSSGPGTPILSFVVRVVPATGSSVRVFLNQPLPNSPAAPGGQNVYVLRQRAGIFGHNAPDWRTLSQEVRQNYAPLSPPLSPPSDPPNYKVRYPLEIDTFNAKILPQSWVVVNDSSGVTPPQLYQVSTAVASTRADFAISTRITSISFSNTPLGNFTNLFGVRTTAVFAQSEALKLGLRPAPPPTLPDRQFPPPPTGSPPNPAAADVDRRKLQLKAPPPTVTILGAGRRLTIVGKRVRVRARANDPAGRFAKDDVFILLERVQLLPVTDTTSKFRWLLQRPSGEQLEFLADDMVATSTFNLISIAVDPVNGSVIASVEDDALVGETLVLDSVVVAPNDPTPALDTLLFTTLPRLVYDRDTLSVFGNIVRATHGETIANEVLGSGRSDANLQFALKRKPLTYVSSTSATGVTSSLVVRVNEVEWHEAPSLFGLGPRSRNFTVRIDDGGQPTITFGDGISGARPPTGVENIVATYRSGIGPDGMVRANQLSLLLTRAVGVRSVTNPLPAFNGVAPATLEQARTNTPLNVRSTGRVVSVLDAEDFARTFAGIGNASAVLLGVGNSRIVHLTVAGSDGEPIPDGSPLLDTLQRAMQEAADPSLKVVIDTFEELPFVLGAKVIVDPDFDDQIVLAAVHDALTAAFSVTARPFGGLVTEAEILSIIQGVAGVVAASVVDFRPESAPPGPPMTSLLASSAHLSSGTTGVIVRAQVAVLALGNPVLGTMPP